MAETAFWCFVILFIYTHLGFPALAWVLSRLRGSKREPRRSGEPTATIIVAAHNEEAVIANRLANIAALNTCQEKVEVIVASDGSTDHTNEIVSAWSDKRVKLLALPRGGRALAHNEAVAVASGDIIVFTDAGTSFREDCLSNLLGPFLDPDVGCVVGRLVYVADRHTLGEHTAFYWNYETRLRRWESDAGLLAVGSGCCMAVRRKLFADLDPHEDADDAVPLDLLLRGYRVVFAPDALAFDVPPSTSRREIRARARMTVLALTAILRRKALLNPFRFPGPALGLLSHRILRFLTPVLVIGALGSSLFLARQPFYAMALLGQLIFYSVGLLGRAAENRGLWIPLLRIPYSFCVWNIGFAKGVLQVLRGETVTTY